LVKKLNPNRPQFRFINLFGASLWEL